MIDNAPTRRGLVSTHVEYGKKDAAFSADFMIGRGYILFDF
ncbi:MAG: hypothetical protein EOO20_06700 [Chryseobacterium sp.]|nr:MAG: hypothetical protein EOO20_06700 [Chryseobacterium sp.]